MPDEARIKAGVVSHDHRILAEVQEGGDPFLIGPLSPHVSVRDAGKLLDVIGNGLLRIHELREAVYDASVLDLHGADLNDLVFQGRKSRGLNIKDHESAGKVLAFRPDDALLLIVHKAPLHSQQKPELTALGNGVKGRGKYLYAVVIRDRQGLPAPLCCSADIFSHISHAVHIAHLGMKVQLDALFSLRHPVHPGLRRVLPFFDPLDAADAELRIEAAVGGRHLSVNGKPFAGLQDAGKLLRLIFLAEKPAGDGVRLIGYVEFDDIFAVSGLHQLRAEDEAGNDHASHALFQGLDLKGLSRKIIAVYHIRVVGLFVLLRGPLVDGLFVSLLSRLWSGVILSPVLLP